MRNIVLLLAAVLLASAGPARAGEYWLSYQDKPYSPDSVDGWPEDTWDGAAGAEELHAWVWVIIGAVSGNGFVNGSARAHWQKTWEWIPDYPGEQPGFWYTTTTGYNQGSAYSGVRDYDANHGATARARVDWGASGRSAQSSSSGPTTASFDQGFAAFTPRVGVYYNEWTVDRTETALASGDVSISTDCPAKGDGGCGLSDTRVDEWLSTFVLTP